MAGGGGGWHSFRWQQNSEGTLRMFLHVCKHPFLPDDKMCSCRVGSKHLRFHLHLRFPSGVLTLRDQVSLTLARWQPQSELGQLLQQP